MPKEVLELQNANQRGLPSSSDTTVSRRNLLDWLGKASVFALGAEVLAACGHVDRTPDDGGVDGETGDLDGALGDSGDVGIDGDVGTDGDYDRWSDAEGGIDADAELSDPWAFHPPGEAPGIFEGWPERTVDRQELAEILRDWRLEIGGMVEREVTLTFPDLLELARLDQVMDFHCVEGWSIDDVPWNGVHLSTLVELAGGSPEATHLSFLTVDRRYNESLPIEIALEEHTMLSYGVDGHTLPLSHGFPMRLVIPRLFGYKSAKYIDRIELTDGPINGFWVAAGYPYLGEVPEARLREGRY